MRPRDFFCCAFPHLRPEHCDPGALVTDGDDVVLLLSAARDGRDGRGYEAEAFSSDIGATYILFFYGTEDSTVRLACPANLEEGP